MKKNLYLILIVTCAVIAGCSERYTPSEWERTQYGTIQFVNNNSDPYLITVKGNTPLSFTLAKGSYITKSVEAGYYNVHVKQKSGYIFYPTEKDYEFYVRANENAMVSF